MDRPPLTFRPITRADFARIGAWLAESQVQRWWHDDASPAGVEAQYGPTVDGADPTQVFITLLGGEPIGLIQRYDLDDEPEFGAELRSVCAVPPGALSLDYFIAEAARRGRGLGTRMVGELVADCWSAYPQAPAAIVAVAAANVASWRMLERVGFRRIAEGKLTPDNPIDPPDHVIYRIDRPTG